jgi:hypothetical protein
MTQPTKAARQVYRAMSVEQIPAPIDYELLPQACGKLETVGRRLSCCSVGYWLQRCQPANLCPYSQSNAIASGFCGLCVLQRLEGLQLR